MWAPAPSGGVISSGHRNIAAPASDASVRAAAARGRMPMAGGRSPRGGRVGGADADALMPGPP